MTTVSHDKFELKQMHFSVTSSAVMIRGETQIVGATITCLVTLCATNSWSVTWSGHFPVGDHRDGHERFVVCASGPKQLNEHTFSLKRLIILSNRPSKQSQREIMLILLLGTTCHVFLKNVVIIMGRNCHDHVSDQELGATKNVTKHLGIQSTN